MAEVGRVQDKSMILGNLAFQRVELERTLSKAHAIESEISRLETDLRNIGESLNNPMACLNPIEFVMKKCSQCGFYGQCTYRGKGDYERFKSLNT